MYHFIFILSLVLSGVFCGTTTVGTKADLLAVIRQDLRRNNDDYLESTISEQTLTSSKPPSTNEEPVSTKNLKTANTLTTTKIVTTTDSFKTTAKPSAPFRRSFQSSELLPIVDKPRKFKHRPIKMDSSQLLMTMTKIPGTEARKPTRYTRTYKSNGTSRENDLDRPEKTVRQKFSITIGEKAKSSESDEELQKMHAFIKHLEKKETTMATSTLKADERTQKKTQGTTKTEPQRMGLVINENNWPPMVVPLRDKTPVTPDVISWEMPHQETTSGELIRMGAKKNSVQMPILRATDPKDDKKQNLLPLVYKWARNETTNKPKNSEKKPRVERVEKIEKKVKFRQKTEDTNKIINNLRMKLREGLMLTSLPPGELLDMWPARGPRVHALRLKNRLCQRSVLLNEGPKYDSKGNTYLPRFKPRLVGKKRIIDFHQTRLPRFVLPRCCNCCRKSVLGCE